MMKSRRVRWAGHITRMGEARIMYNILVGEPKWKTPFGGPTLRWEDCL